MTGDRKENTKRGRRHAESGGNVLEKKASSDVLLQPLTGPSVRNPAVPFGKNERNADDPEWR